MKGEFDHAHGRAARCAAKSASSAFAIFNGHLTEATPARRRYRREKAAHRAIRKAGFGRERSACTLTTSGPSKSEQPLRRAMGERRGCSGRFDTSRG
jgi:hypothetical protein